MFNLPWHFFLLPEITPLFSWSQCVLAAQLFNRASCCSPVCFGKDRKEEEDKILSLITRSPEQVPFKGCAQMGQQKNPKESYVNPEGGEWAAYLSHSSKISLVGNSLASFLFLALISRIGADKYKEDDCTPQGMVVTVPELQHKWGSRVFPLFHVHLLVVWAFLLPFKSLEIRPSLIHFAGSRTQHFSGKSLSFVKLFSFL